MEDYIEIVNKVTECEKSEKSEKRQSADQDNSLNSLNSRSHLCVMDPDDSTTWPAYMVRLYNEAMTVGGEALAQRQIAAELAFWSSTDLEEN